MGCEIDTGLDNRVFINCEDVQLSEGGQVSFEFNWASTFLIVGGFHVEQLEGRILEEILKFSCLVLSQASWLFNCPSSLLLLIKTTMEVTISLPLKTIIIIVEVVVVVAYPSSIMRYLRPSHSLLSHRHGLLHHRSTVRQIVVLRHHVGWVALIILLLLHHRHSLLVHHLLILHFKDISAMQDFIVKLSSAWEFLVVEQSRSL